MFDPHFRGRGISTCDNLDDLAGSGHDRRAAASVAGEEPAPREREADGAHRMRNA